MPYVCLSYTWGHPEATDTPMPDPPMQPIIIDGLELLIGQNLHDALIAIRSLMAGEPEPVPDKYLWIDAVCINQADTREKNHQVSMMHWIYKAAKRVVVWLGPQKPVITRRVNILLRRCASLSQTVVNEALSSVVDPNMWYTDLISLLERNIDQRYHDAGLPPRSYEYWKDLASILEREWWTRVWTFQEFFLCKNSQFLFGTRFLEKSEFAITICNLARWDFGNWLKSRLGPIKGVLPCDGMAQRVHETQRALFHLLNDPKYRNYRAFTMGIVEDTSKGLSPPLTLFFMLDASANRQATKDVDRVFGLVGLMHCFAPEGSDGPWLEVDYDKTAQEVFIETARYLITNSSWLGLLAFMSFGRRTPELPTYIPDFAGTPVLRYYRDDFEQIVLPQLIALANTAPNRGIPSFEGKFLSVYGQLVGVIESVGETSIEMLQGDTVLPNTAQVIAGCDMQYAYAPQHRIEAAWRTILKGAPHVEHKPLGTSFLTWWFILLIKYARDHFNGPGAMRKMLNAYPAVQEVIATIYADPAQWNNLVDVMSKEMEKPSFGEDTGWKSLENDAKVFRDCIHPLNSHRIFRTNRGHLGTAKSTSICAGDTVWILARAPCALVLRKINDGWSENRYILLSQTYVHGFDFGGKVLEKLEGRWENIVIE
ncbi:putative ankyrin and het domain protein [Phaeomoniella chlamydospora]|uniref:Putative ankyrin and het domain protein n=1 Tax=Phaeomoniella chlamydospora TaxID=158046 RepID=A0A0G2H911_PHACM|nr:putative ankyrin and het domain protein [Phaeomoniella chlamydospora]